MYITKYGCVFLKLGESIYVAMDLIPILLGSLPLAHNAQHSLVYHTCQPLLKIFLDIWDNFPGFSSVFRDDGSAMELVALP